MNFVVDVDEVCHTVKMGKYPVHDSFRLSEELDGLIDKFGGTKKPYPCYLFLSRTDAEHCDWSVSLEDCVTISAFGVASNETHNRSHIGSGPDFGPVRGSNICR